MEMSKKLRLHESQDRISDLPEPLLHLILSLLNIKQVVQTSVLSRKWRSLWVTLPYLNIDEQFWKVNGKLCEDKFEFFVDRILCRDDFNIQKFSLSCKTYNGGDRWDSIVYKRINGQINQIDEWLSYKRKKGQRYQINKWIRYVLRRNVQELQLEQISFKPTLVSAVSQVKFLRLENVNFSAGKLLFSCRNMETLILKGCEHRNLESLEIDAPQLKYLMIDCIDTIECVIRICAPNLTSLKIEGDLYEDYILGKFPVLDTADFLPNCASEYWDDFEEKEALGLNKFLKGVVSVKSLTIAVESFQVFSDMSKMSQWVPVSCQNVKYLKLMYWNNMASVRSISTLLESFPHVETLVIEGNEVSNNHDIETGDWGEQLSLRCMFLHLKYIEIHNLKGCQNELKLLEFLVKNARVLENITIRASITSINKEKKLTEFSKKLHLLPKASSITILLILSKYKIK